LFVCTLHTFHKLGSYIWILQQSSSVLSNPAACYDAVIHMSLRVLSNG